MSLRFATGKSSQAFAVELISRVNNSASLGLNLGLPSDWRKNYQKVFCRLTELEATSESARLQGSLLAQVASLIVDEQGTSLADLLAGGFDLAREVRFVSVQGAAEPAELATIGVPTAQALIANNLAEQGIVDALTEYDRKPIPDRNQFMISIGANAELSLVDEWLGVGGRVLAIARPNSEKWSKRIQQARLGAGELLVPVLAERAAGASESELQNSSDEVLAELAGLDLESQLPEVIRSILDLGALHPESRLAIIGSVYAPGARQILASAAQDAVFAAVAGAFEPRRLSFGWLATPLDSVVLPAPAVEARLRAWASRGVLRRLRDLVLRCVLGSPRKTSDSRVQDFSVSRQGSSYLLAKRIERWRANVAAHAGIQVWFQVAPPARTHSTLDYKIVRAAFRGAERFGVTTFEPWMLRDLLTASLIGTLNSGKNLDESAAIHGGVWRGAYEPHSIWLPATVLGWRALI